MIGQARRLYDYRFFIASSVRNEFKSKFSRSKFGALWVIINPLVQSIVYATVLSSIISAKLPGIDNKYAFALYLLSGMLGWALFQEVTMSCINVFVDKADLMKKVSFPRICLPVIASCTALVNNFFLFLAILVVFLILGHGFGWSIAVFPLVVFINFVLAASLGTLLGILNVLIRDVSQAALIVFQALFWLTPIVYTPNILPERVRVVLELSPLYKIIEMYHVTLVYSHLPRIAHVLQVSGLALFLMLLAGMVYRRAASDMADAL